MKIIIIIIIRAKTSLTLSLSLYLSLSLSDHLKTLNRKYNNNNNNIIINNFFFYSVVTFHVQTFELQEGEKGKIHYYYYYYFEAFAKRGEYNTNHGFILPRNIITIIMICYRKSSFYRFQRKIK